MANRIKVAVSQTILTLHAQGWSFRKIAWTLGIHRETASRYVRAQVAKPASNEARTWMPRGRRPGSSSPLKKSAGKIARPTNVSFFEAFVARAISPRWRLGEKLDFFNGLLDAESEPTQDEPMDDISEDSADTIPTREDQEASAMPFQCNGCGKKTESYFSAVRTYFRDCHYCQDCSENGTMEEKERERHEKKVIRERTRRTSRKRNGENSF